MKWNMLKKEHTITGKHKKPHGNENNISMDKTNLFQTSITVSTAH